MIDGAVWRILISNWPTTEPPDTRLAARPWDVSAPPVASDRGQLKLLLALLVGWPVDGDDGPSIDGRVNASEALQCLDLALQLSHTGCGIPGHRQPNICGLRMRELLLKRIMQPLGPLPLRAATKIRENEADYWDRKKPVPGCDAPFE
jgi:hypothetical protein